MGMDIDEPRCDDQAMRVDFFGGSPINFPQRGDMAVLDGDIPGNGRRAGAVDYLSVTDNEIIILPKSRQRESEGQGSEAWPNEAMMKN